MLMKAYRKWRDGRTYPSYESALKKCGDGYADSNLAQVTVERAKSFRNRLATSGCVELDLGFMRPAAPLVHGDVETVIDFGGGAGLQYWIARRLTRRKLRWNVVETDALVTTARCLEEDGLKFFSSIEEAAADLGNVHLIYASGSLPYTPDPYTYLRRLVSVGAHKLFITRNALANFEAVIIQRVRLSVYSDPLLQGIPDRENARPVTICNQTKFETIMSERYDIRLRLHEDRKQYRIKRKKADMFGYYCELK